MPVNYHPSDNIGKKKYKGEVVLAHSRYHQENPSSSCTIYQHFTPLNIDAILQQRRNTEGLLLCNNSPKVSIDTHAFVKAWCKGHFHQGCYYPGDYQEKNQDLQVKQRALDRWFQHLDDNLPKTSSQDLPGIDFPSLHWCKRDDIRDPCQICGQVLPDTTWKYQTDETCCGRCTTNT